MIYSVYNYDTGYSIILLDAHEALTLAASLEHSKVTSGEPSDAFVEVIYDTRSPSVGHYIVPE